MPDESTTRTITISGNKDTMKVMINAAWLKPDNGSHFDWGYIGQKPNHLAVKILQFLYGQNAVRTYLPDFRKVIAGFPKGESFTEEVECPS